MELTWTGYPTCVYLVSIWILISVNQGIEFRFSSKTCKPSEPGVVGSNPTGPVYFSQRIPYISEIALMHYLPGRYVRAPDTRKRESEASDTNLKPSSWNFFASSTVAASVPAILPWSLQDLTTFCIASITLGLERSVPRPKDMVRSVGPTNPTSILLVARISSTFESASFVSI